MTAADKKFFHGKTAILIALVCAGLVADSAGFIDGEQILLQVQAAAGKWWAPPAVIAAMAVFYLLALPGSMFFWIAGLLYQPSQATLIVTAGGVLGALLAQAFARSMAGLPANMLKRNSPFFRFLERNTDLFTLCAIRTFPFFPHSVINYGAGILRISVGKFAVASVVGYAFKGFIYSSAVHGAAGAQSFSDLVNVAVLFPLLALAALLLTGRILHRRWLAREAGGKQKKISGR